MAKRRKSSPLEDMLDLVAMLPWWGELVMGTVWSLFESLIIILQAFIFTVLTVVYLGMANMQDH